jgi:hypothetical protein
VITAYPHVSRETLVQVIPGYRFSIAVHDIHRAKKNSPLNPDAINYLVCMVIYRLTGFAVSPGYIFGVVFIPNRFCLNEVFGIVVGDVFDGKHANSPVAAITA